MAYSPQNVYDYYNRRYFDGLLPKIPVSWSEVIGQRPKRYYGVYCSNSAEGKILLSSELKNHPKIWRMTLLHEMAHVKFRGHPKEIYSISRNRHSKLWQKEMLRLAKEGAFKKLW